MSDKQLQSPDQSWTDIVSTLRSQQDISFCMKMLPHTQLVEIITVVMPTSSDSIGFPLLSRGTIGMLKLFVVRLSFQTLVTAGDC
jgi:hypothetical protein